MLYFVLCLYITLFQSKVPVAVSLVIFRGSFNQDFTDTDVEPIYIKFLCTIFHHNHCEFDGPFPY